MKWIEWAVVGVLIFFPFATINQIDVELMRQTMLLELHYDAAMDAAVDAAAQALIINADQQHESRYESVKRVEVNREEALTAFYRTLYANFGISGDPVAQGVLNRYIPVIVVIVQQAAAALPQVIIRDGKIQFEITSTAASTSIRYRTVGWVVTREQVCSTTPFKQCADPRSRPHALFMNQEVRQIGQHPDPPVPG